MTRLRHYSDMLLAPGRFWMGVACLLALVGGVAYTYGAWYGGVLVRDAVPVRQIKDNQSWKSSMQFVEDLPGLRRRVQRPAPDALTAELYYDPVESVDLSSGDYVPYSRAVWELRSEETTEEGKEEPAKPTYTHEEYLRQLQESGVVGWREQRASGRTHAVTVGEGLGESEARALAARLLEQGRDASLVAKTDARGRTVYEVRSGGFSSQAEAQAYAKELEAAGLKSTARVQSDSGASIPPTPATGPQAKGETLSDEPGAEPAPSPDQPAGGSAPESSGGGEVPPPTPPSGPRSEQGGQGVADQMPGDPPSRKLTDL